MSPLQFNIEYIGKKTFKRLNELWHSRLPLCRNCWNGFCFGAIYKNVIYAVAWWSAPIAQNRLKNGNHILELRRMAIHDDAPKNTASRFLSVMVKIIKKDRPDIEKLISYQDTKVHIGTIYRASGWTPVQTSNRFLSWKNRTDFNRIDQSDSIKVRWEKQIRKKEKKSKCSKNTIAHIVHQQKKLF